jgi:hypothetical protein
MIHTIYLVKFSETAAETAYDCIKDFVAGEAGIIAVEIGRADGMEAIPSMYYGKNFFYCAVRRIDADSPGLRKHEIIVCSAEG